MSPEEYERLKNQEKEHLKKLKELKTAIRVLDRQKKIQSTLAKISQASADALDTQSEMVERLAMETAMHEARLDVTLDSSDDSTPDASLEEELQQERARALVEQIRHSMGDAPHENPDAGGGASAQESGASAQESERSGRQSGRGSAKENDGNPTQDRHDRPEKTIGRM